MAIALRHDEHRGNILSATRKALCGLLASALFWTALGFAAPAEADSQRHRDPRSDVTDAFGNPVSTRTGTDVIRLRNNYAGRRLRMSMTSVNLPRTDWGAYWTIRTGPDTGYGLYFMKVGRDVWLTFQPALIGPPGRLMRGESPPTQCKAARARVVGNKVVASVPSRCFDNKRRVRIAGAMQNNDRRHERFDDSRRRGVDLSQPNDEFGPFLSRG